MFLNVIVFHVTVYILEYCFSKYFVYFREDSQLSLFLFFFPEAQQRLLLVTVFALSVHYQPVDVSLAISTGLLNVLSQLCGTDTMLGQPLQLLPKTGVSQLSTALKVASTRLLQILAITTG